MNDDGFDREVLGHMMCYFVRCSSNPICDVVYFRKVLDDVSRTVMENRRIERSLYYGGDSR